MATLAPSQLRADLGAPGKPDKRRRYTHNCTRTGSAPRSGHLAVLFLIPSFASFYFGFTRWTFFDVEFIGFENFVTFFSDPQLEQGFVNTLIYGGVTSGLKVVLGLLLGVLLTSGISRGGTCGPWCSSPFWSGRSASGSPSRCLDPFDGVINRALAIFGIQGPGWLTDPAWRCYSIALVDVWKGVGLAALSSTWPASSSIPQEYYEAAKVDGASAWKNFCHITVPLVGRRPRRSSSCR